MEVGNWKLEVGNWKLKIGNRKLKMEISNEWNYQHKFENEQTSCKFIKFLSKDKQSIKIIGIELYIKAEISNEWDEWHNDNPNE